MYFQHDKRWSRCRWYDPDLDQAVRALTEVAHKVQRDPLGRDGEEATLGESGCWHVAVASMLSHLKQRHDGETYTPATLLRALREGMLGTLSGYVEHPFIDPVSILTDCRVQLSQYRDFGELGVDSSCSELRELLSTVDGKTSCAIANVKSHEFRGIKPSHYVLVWGRSSSADFKMHDPGNRSRRLLFRAYRRIYQITLYSLFNSDVRRLRP